jgi:hypothetical protein
LWLFLFQSPSARGGPRVSVTVHTEASPEEELVNLPFTAPILVPDHTEPLIWEGKARQGLKLIARAYRGNKARGGGGAVKGATAGKTATLLPGSKKAPETTLRLTDNNDDDDEDDDDDDEDDDDGVAALLRRTNSVLNRKAGQMVATTKPVEKAIAAASTVASAPAAAAGLKIKQAGFLDSCSPAKETGELVAMKTGTGTRTTERFASMLSSVADPECLSRILIFNPSRIPDLGSRMDPTTAPKEDGKKSFVLLENFVLPSFEATIIIKL